jgi:type IV pilus assembly protein PilA
VAPADGTTVSPDARPDDAGFSLIELAVVILIIGILLAVAIPTFVGIRRPADDVTAKSHLLNVRELAISLAADKGFNLTLTDIQGGEPELVIYNDGRDATQPREVSFTDMATNSYGIYASAKSLTGTCFLIKINQQAQVFYGKVANATSCKPADAASAATLANW